jgi:peptide/nickel transport system ATP-binding protein
MERLRAYPHQLSGGMRQRVAIAIALLHKPKLIVADEPTTALDVTIQGQILFEAQRLCRESGTAMIWVTHDLAVVAGLADRIAVMYAGRIVETGSTADVLDHPQHPYTQGLIGSLPSRATAGASRLRQIPGMAPSLLALPPGCAFRAALRARERSMRGGARGHDAAGPSAQPPGALLDARAGGCGAGGRGMSQSTSPGPAAAVAPLVALDQVSQRFGDRGAPGWFERALRQLRLSRPGPVTHAVDSVSLAVQPGEVVGLVGESGCGKSTLGRMAAGLLHPTEGTVRVDGVAWPDMTPAQKLRGASCASRWLPAPVQRRPAPAHRHGARAGGPDPGTGGAATSRCRRWTWPSRRRC